MSGLKPERCQRRQSVLASTLGAANTGSYGPVTQPPIAITTGQDPVHKNKGPCCPVSSAACVASNGTVTCPFIARQRVGKHVPAKANKRNNSMSIARQRRCKQASLATEDGDFRGVRAEELS
jgi:hypothetical protein